MLFKNQLFFLLKKKNLLEKQNIQSLQKRQRSQSILIKTPRQIRKIISLMDMISSTIDFTEVNTLFSFVNICTIVRLFDSTNKRKCTSKTTCKSSRNRKTSTNNTSKDYCTILPLVEMSSPL